MLSPPTMVGHLTYAGEERPILNSAALDLLGVGDRTEAVTKALKKGIIKLQSYESMTQNQPFA